MHAAWIEDYDPDHTAATHLIKVHQPEQADKVTSQTNIILTTWRPYEECLASRVRMGWLTATPEALRRAYLTQKKLYNYWAQHSDLEIKYTEIQSDPARAIAKIASVLGEMPDPVRDARLAKELVKMEAPTEGHYDKRTLLHPKHKSGDNDETLDVTPEEIAQYLRNDANDA